MDRMDLDDYGALIETPQSELPPPIERFAAALRDPDARGPVPSPPHRRPDAPHIPSAVLRTTSPANPHLRPTIPSSALSSQPSSAPTSRRAENPASPKAACMRFVRLHANAPQTANREHCIGGRFARLRSAPPQP